MKTLSATTIALGGEEIQVTRADGASETVKVSLIKIKQIPEYLGQLGDEQSLAAFLCGQTKDWADNLAQHSVMDIIEKGHELNFELACRWAKFRADVTVTAEALKKSHPGLTGTPTDRI